MNFQKLLISIFQRTHEIMQHEMQHEKLKPLNRAVLRYVPDRN